VIAAIPRKQVNSLADVRLARHKNQLRHERVPSRAPGFCALIFMMSVTVFRAKRRQRAPGGSIASTMTPTVPEIERDMLSELGVRGFNSCAGDQSQVKV
jgi:hypothetical protein